jgi:serine/threonine protein kinase
VRGSSRPSELVAHDDTWPGPARAAAVARAGGAAPTLALPAWIGGFRPLRRLRTGPLAEVFVARRDDDRGPVQLAAVKRIQPSLLYMSEARSLFAHEAELLALCDHPSIPQAIDLGAATTEGWFATELVRGRSLVEVVKRAEQLGLRVPLRHALAIVASLAEALDHLHGLVDDDGKALGVVHTGVTPANVTLAEEGRVVLADLGAARSALRPVTLRARRPVGSVAYMSPEQSRGEELDRRSDVYSLGVLLWELCTWSRLYPRLGPEQVLARVAIGAVPLPSTVRADIPAELEDVMMIALQPSAQRRFATAGELAKALRRLAGPADPRGQAAWVRRVAS